MINIQGKLNRSLLIACSGGVDSMAVVDFLRKNHNCTLLFFNHGTDVSRDAQEFLQEFVFEKNKEFSDLPRATKLELKIGTIQAEKTVSESWEEYWRNQRYNYFKSFDDQVLTCHHLGDCVETWIWSCMHGTGKIIPYANGNVIRPFRLNRKEEFVNWCRSHSVPWIEDTSNEDTKYMRNYIRKELLEKCLILNPGLYKVIRKKVLEDFPG
jgi:tRNA(Ile)-lysidine synthase